MSIETLQDYNAMLAQCGCCEIAPCPIPVLQTQCLDFFPTLSNVYGWATPYNVADWRSGESLKTTYTDTTAYGVFVYWKIEGEIDISLMYGADGCFKQDLQTPRYYGGDTPPPGEDLIEDQVITTEIINPVSWSALLAEYQSQTAAYTTGAAETCWDSGCSYASSTVRPPRHSGGSYYSPYYTAKPQRVRFRIPPVVPIGFPHPPFTGTRVLITYDIKETPQDATAPYALGTPFLSSVDQTILWLGPGTGDEDDPSWLTDWVVIPPPDNGGRRQVVNIRFTCYENSPYGPLTQVTGEAFPP